MKKPLGNRSAAQKKRCRGCTDPRLSRKKAILDQKLVQMEAGDRGAKRNAEDANTATGPASVWPSNRQPP